MGAEQTACFRHDARGIGERPDGAVESTKERRPVFPAPERLLDAHTLARGPGPIGGELNECDLIARPGPRRRTVDAERRDPLSILDQWDADKCQRAGGDESCALLIGESFVR